MSLINKLPVPLSALLLSACVTLAKQTTVTEPPLAATELAAVVARAERGERAAIHDLCYRNLTGSRMEPNHAEAALWCGRGAALGTPNTQFLFASQIYQGKGVGKDDAAALRWYSKAADQGHRDALFMQYVMYATGEGTPKDKIKAMASLKRSVEGGSKFAEEEMKIVKEGEKAESAREAAQHGDLKALEALAMHFHLGAIIARDYPEAIRWYELAAAQGSLVSINNLADMYENGAGVEKDYGRAVSLYRQAADKGFYVSVYSLGTLYESGKGLKKSPFLAYTYYRLASAGLKKGYWHDETEEQAARLAATLSATELSDADRAVRAWKPGMPLPE